MRESSSKPAIVVIGSANTDMVIRTARLPSPGETVLGGAFLMNPGGKGANQAVAAARLGASVVFVARVGDDIFGRDALKGFQTVGIDVSFVTVDPRRPSGVATIAVDDRGENMIVVAPGANEALCPEDIDRAIDTIGRADVVLLQLETPLSTVVHATKVSRVKKRTIILNPAPGRQLPAELFANIDVITPNEAEAMILTGVFVDSDDAARRAASALRDMGVGTVIITRGARGAYVHDDAFCGVVPSVPVKAVDTTAAGDVFNGALAVALGAGRDIETSVGFANRAAALSVTRKGAQVSAPTLSELE